MRNKKNILVTGSNGQLGQELKAMSIQYSDLAFQFYNSSDLDITNKLQLESVLKKTNFDYCINCAAYTNVEKAEEEPIEAYKVNSEGVKKLTDILKKTNTILIHISTDYVFDGSKNKAYIEEDNPDPINVYGKSKLEGEQYIVKHLKRYFILRTSWLYSNRNKNFYKSILSKLETNEKIKVISSQKGSPTSAREFSRGIFHIIKKDNKSYGIFHFSNKGLTNWYIFAKKIIESIDISKINQLIETKEFETKAKRPINSKLDSTKFETEFDFKILSWENALKEIITTT